MGALQQVVDGFADEFGDARRRGALGAPGEPEQAEVPQRVKGQGDRDFVKIPALPPRRVGRLQWARAGRRRGRRGLGGGGRRPEVGRELVQACFGTFGTHGVSLLSVCRASAANSAAAGLVVA